MALKITKAGYYYWTTYQKDIPGGKYLYLGKLGKPRSERIKTVMKKVLKQKADIDMDLEALQRLLTSNQPRKPS